MKAPASHHQSGFSAQVLAADGVRFDARARSAEELTTRIVGYVLERCDHVLWPDDASRVRSLVDGNEPGAAIELYFAQVGERWDEERLEIGAASVARTRTLLPR